MTFSDQQLKDYLAGTLPADAAADLETRIEQDTALEARLFALDFAQAAPLRDAYAQIPDAPALKGLEDIIMGAREAEPPAVQSRAWAWPAAAAVAVFAVGAAWFGGQASQPAPSWQDQVAVYQTLYVAETLSSVMTDQTEVAAQLASSERALGRTLPLEVVGDLEGTKLLRAQILGFEGAPLIQMAYLSDAGVPFALCAIRLNTPANDAPAFEQLSGMPVVHWSDGEFGYMIVGDMERDVLESMAQTLVTSL